MLAVALAALALHLAGSDALRERVRAASRERIGREVEYGKLAFALSPLRVVLFDARVAGAEPGAPPLLEASRAEVPLALGELLRGELAARSVAFADGWLRPVPKLAIALTEGQIEVRADAEPGLALEGWATPFQGGALRVGGRFAAGGEGGVDWDLDVELEGIDAASLRPALGRVSQLAGRASGSLHIGGPVGSPERIRAHLVLEDARLEIEDFRAAGRLEATVELPPGRFSIDAAGAELETRGPVRYRKAAGVPASVEGRFERRPDGGFDLREARLRVR